MPDSPHKILQWCAQYHENLIGPWRQMGMTLVRTHVAAGYYFLIRQWHVVATAVRVSSVVFPTHDLNQLPHCLHFEWRQRYFQPHTELLG